MFHTYVMYIHYMYTHVQVLKVKSKVTGIVNRRYTHVYFKKL